MSQPPESRSVGHRAARPASVLILYAALAAVLTYPLVTRLTVMEPANIAGAVVTGFFSGQGNNLIQVWQTPALAGLAPFGLPTSQNLSTIDVSIVDWFQRR